MAISKRQAALNEQKGQEGEKIVGEAIEREEKCIKYAQLKLRK